MSRFVYVIIKSKTQKVGERNKRSVGGRVDSMEYQCALNKEFDISSLSFV